MNPGSLFQQNSLTTLPMANIPLENSLKVPTHKIQQSFEQAKNVLFTTGIVGQYFFVLYIAIFYGWVISNGYYEKLNGHGAIEGDTMGNFALGIHVFLAAIIMFGGPLQFLSSIRKRYPVFHRWNGRIFFSTALITVCAGLYMNATRGAHGGMLLALGNGLNALLIGAFTFMAWRTALQQDFISHKKWALRAFLMVSGVWFFRVGYGLWILLTGFTAIGIHPDLTGPFDRFLGFGHSIVPLVLLELYFLAKASKQVKVKRVATVSMWILTLLLAAGIVMVGVVFWVPAFG